MKRQERQLDGAIYAESTALLKRAQEVTRKNEIGVQETVWRPKLEYPQLPYLVGVFSDMHYGSIRSDYDLMNQNLDTVESTPNTGMVTNGDMVDVFNVVRKWATGTYEDPLPPELQTYALLDRLASLDQSGKLGVVSYGNHEDALGDAGYEWFEVFGKKFKKAKVMPTGGKVDIKVGKQSYEVGMTHRYWGYSKINPLNVCRNFLFYEHPDADVILLAHSHQSAMGTFEYAGKDRLFILGGTYKTDDRWSRKMGFGGRGGRPGYSFMLSGDKHHVQGFPYMEDAQQVMLDKIYRAEAQAKGEA